MAFSTWYARPVIHPAIAKPRGGRGAPKTTCCGQCRDRDFCRDDANCCLECHFHYEEILAFPFIPAEGQQILREQHRWLAANGFPPDVVEVHAQYEMEWFRPFCPPEIIMQLDEDHAEYGEGRLQSRDAPLVVAPQPALYAPAPPPVQDNWMGQRATLGIAHGYIGRTALAATGFRTG